jgi:hypothetical protein
MSILGQAKRRSEATLKKFIKEMIKLGGNKVYSNVEGIHMVKLIRGDLMSSPFSWFTHHLFQTWVCDVIFREKCFDIFKECLQPTFLQSNEHILT